MHDVKHLSYRMRASYQAFPRSARIVLTSRLRSKVGLPIIRKGDRFTGAADAGLQPPASLSWLDAY